MFYCELYDKNKVYVTPNGQMCSPEYFCKEYPAAAYEKMVVFLIGNTIYKSSPFVYLRQLYNIDDSITEKEALQIIMAKEYEKETESTPIERIAASLEYLVLLSIGEQG